MIIDNPEVLRKVVGEHLVPEGHEHSEDIIHDPYVADWVDRYAEAFRKLVDPVWGELIEDPEYRWYKEGREYKELFRFKHSDAPPVPDWARSKEKEKVGVSGA